MKWLLKDQRGIATLWIVVFIVLGMIVVGVIGAGVVILGNDMKITVKNQSCGTLDVAKGSAALKLNFLPGINVPSQIAQGDTAVVQVPRRFVDYVTVTTGSIEVSALVSHSQLAHQASTCSALHGTVRH